MRFKGERNAGLRVLRVALLVYAMLVLGHTALQVASPQRSGVLAMAAIFEPFVWVPLTLLPLVSLWSRTREMRIALMACILVFGARFGPTLISRQTPLQSDSTRAQSAISVLTWNVLSSNHKVSELTDVLTTAPAAIVALQEITIAETAALAGSQQIKEQYPYYLLAPHPHQEQLAGVDGLALLTRYPILEHGAFQEPAGLWARLDLGQGRRMVVINSTPMRAELGILAYDPRTRDEQIRRLRTVIAPILERQEPLLVVGDFNVSQREPAYRELVEGLQDAHLAVGLGFGNTWRPSRLAKLPLALIRIDYLLSSPEIKPVSIDVDCTPHGSDHCIVRGAFEIAASIAGTGAGS